MPLYTYILVYKGHSYVAQGRYSNFRGFVSSWTSELPPNVLPGLTPRAFFGEVDPVHRQKCGKQRREVIPRKWKQL